MDKNLGKIEHRLFERFIQDSCGHPRAEIATGPQFGVDVSVVNLPNGLGMALTSDPLSLIPSLGLQESAWLSVHLMANDMATTGHAPMYGQFVLNLPSTFSKSDFHIYWEYIHKFCAALKIGITGGHTGFIEGQHSTIAGGGTLITIAPAENLLVSRYARKGDHILVTKSCALSASAILAMSFPETVKNKAGNEIYQQASESFYHTSSLPEALLANQSIGISAMHDVTEGGVLGAIYELAVASGNGALVYNDKLPIEETQAKICAIFDLDPRYCIGAGSMIIACREETTKEVIERLEKNGIPCVDVGQLSDQESGIRLMENDKVTDLEYKEEDPYWNAFFRSVKQGLK